MNKCRILAVGLLLLFLCSCSAATKEPFFPEETRETEAAPGRTLILTHSYSEDSSVQAAALEFGRLLSENTDFTLEIYPNNTLGNVNTGNDAVTKGTVDLRIGGGSGSIQTILSWIPAMEDLSLDAVQRAVQPGEELYSMLEEEFSARGVHLLGVMKPVYRLLTSNRKIESVNDFAGLRLRLVGGATDNAYWKALGILPDTSYQVEEVYTALQMGLIDAEENPLTTIYDQKFYEQQEFLIILHNRIQINVLYMNQNCWDSLSPEEKEVVQLAARQAIEVGNEHAERHEEEAASVIEKEMQVITLPAEEEEKIRRKSGKAVYAVMEEDYGADVIEDILRIVRRSAEG